MDDPVAIVLKRRPDVVFDLGMQPTARGGAPRRLWRERLALALLERFTNAGQTISLRGNSFRGQRADSEVLQRASGRDRQRFAACPGPRLARTPCAGQQQRHVLARMIGARRGRVVSVVGRDDEQIAFAKPIEHARRAAASKRSRFAAYPATSLRWPYSVSKSTRFANTSPAGVSRHDLENRVDALARRCWSAGSAGSRGRRTGHLSFRRPRPERRARVNRSSSVSPNGSSA